MHACLLFVALTLGQKDPAPAETPAAEAVEKKLTGEELEAKVKSLVKQLDSVQQSRREEAEKELIALGSDIIGYLPSVGASTPAEMKNRLARIRQTLATKAIEAATKATEISLEGKMKLSEALEGITKQSGNHFEDYRERFNQVQSDPPLDLKLKKVSFWEALDTVLDEAEVTIYNYDEEADALAYVSQGDSTPRKERASYGGPFRFDPVRVETTLDLKKPDNRSLRVALEVAWEPRLKPIVFMLPLEDVKAVDDQDREIPVGGGEGEVEVPVEFSNAGVEIDIPLTLPERSAKQIKSLKGKINATVPGRQETFEFSKLDKARDEQQERGGVTVTLDFARRNADIFEVEVRVRFDKAANALESHRGWIYNNPAYLLDDKGNRIESAGLAASLVQENEVGLSFKFDLEKTPLDKCKFVYKTPAAIYKIPVEFEVKSIDLP